MKVTKQIAENCVAWFNESLCNYLNAYSYEDVDGVIRVYLSIDNYDVEISKDEIIDRSNQWLEDTNIAVEE